MSQKPSVIPFSSIFYDGWDRGRASVIDPSLDPSFGFPTADQAVSRGNDGYDKLSLYLLGFL